MGVTGANDGNGNGTASSSITTRSYSTSPLLLFVQNCARAGDH